MELVRHDHPPLRSPAALVAFTGWGDAGEASSSAVEHLAGRGRIIPLATVDPDGFFDFQVTRPFVELTGDGTRRLVWPDVRIDAVRLEDLHRDLVLVRGAEPNVRWKAFTLLVAETLAGLGVGTAVTLGAFIGQVPHTLPVPLIGVGADPGRLRDRHLFTSRYEGPTGIIGALNVALTDVGIDTVSVWAAVPHYVSAQPYPPGALALLEAAMDLLGCTVELSELTEEAAEFRQAMDVVLEESEGLADYVRELEEEARSDAAGDGKRLVEEIERFLRES